MNQPSLPELDLSDIRVGHYVILELGWMAHPFPRGSFLLTTERELDTLRSLKLKRVRIDPSRCEFPEADTPPASTLAVGDTTVSSVALGLSPVSNQPPVAPSLTDAHRIAQERAERQFQEGARCFKSVMGQVERSPEAAATQAQQFVNGLMTEMNSQGESALRLLDQTQGDRQAQHAVNVMVLCLLLGKAMGMSALELDALGQAAFLHDVGKLRLPTPVRNPDDSLTPAQRKAYESHVALGIEIGRSMKLPNAVLQAIAQHHEAVDGSGFPTASKGDRLSRASQVLALVNRYDGLCNPWNPARALTPHEAVSRLFTSGRARFDAQVLQAFIRMMGVYPPGSMVQLSDGRYAQVQVVNASRPLKPTLLVYEPGRSDSLCSIVDLSQVPDVSVQRSLRADQLPRSALEVLTPRARYCYFFERAGQGPDAQRGAP